MNRFHEVVRRINLQKRIKKNQVFQSSYQYNTQQANKPARLHPRMDIAGIPSMYRITITLPAITDTPIPQNRAILIMATRPVVIHILAMGTRTTHPDMVIIQGHITAITMTTHMLNEPGLVLVLFIIQILGFPISNYLPLLLLISLLLFIVENYATHFDLFYEDQYIFLQFSKNLLFLYFICIEL